MTRKKTSEKPHSSAPEVRPENLTAETAETQPSRAEPAMADDAAVIAGLNVRIAELNDKYLRLYSEFDNYRKRTAKEKIELSKTASETVILAMLPVLDDMDRAMKSVPEDMSENSFIQGVKLIHTKLMGVMTHHGLKEVHAAGKPFDTDLHEAISHYPVEEDSRKNTVIEVIQKGYRLHDKVIRYAKVVVGL